jgi:proline racemase
MTIDGMIDSNADFVVLASGTTSGQPVGCVDATARETLDGLTEGIRRRYFADGAADPESIVAVLTRPAAPGCDYGLRFVIADGPLGGCGEATMFAAAVCSEGAGSRVLFDTAGGRIAATVQDADTVSLRMPAADPVPRTHVVDVDGRDLRVRTVVVGGNTFAAVAAADLGLRTGEEEAATLRQEGDRLLRHLVTRFESEPVGPPGLLLLAEPVVAGTTRSAVVWGDAILNRGPCGTGSCARAILALHDGEITPEQELVHYSPFGHAFRVRVAPDEGPGVVLDLDGEVSRW